MAKIKALSISALSLAGSALSLPVMKQNEMNQQKQKTENSSRRRSSG
jgi:hypothetical protein